MVNRVTLRTALAAVILFSALTPVGRSRPPAEGVSTRPAPVFGAAVPVIEPQTVMLQTMVVTAYTAHDPGMDGRGITASGRPVKEWHTAAGAPSVPFGTKVYVPWFADQPNAGWFVVEDRGGAITEGHLDVYMPDRNAAFAFGQRTLRVYLLFK